MDEKTWNKSVFRTTRTPIGEGSGDTHGKSKCRSCAELQLGCHIKVSQYSWNASGMSSNPFLDRTGSPER